MEDLAAHHAPDHLREGGREGGGEGRGGEGRGGEGRGGEGRGGEGRGGEGRGGEGRGGEGRGGEGRGKKERGVSMVNVAQACYIPPYHMKIMDTHMKNKPEHHFKTASNKQSSQAPSKNKLAGS